MIPEEVAEIATLLRNEYDEGDSDKAYHHSIDVAWKIYNLWQVYEDQRIKGF